MAALYSAVHDILLGPHEHTGTISTERTLALSCRQPKCRVNHRGGIRPNEPPCIHKRLQYYDDMVNNLKYDLRCLNRNLKLRDASLKVSDIYTITACKRKLGDLPIQPRWSGIPAQTTPRLESLMRMLRRLEQRRSELLMETTCWANATESRPGYSLD